MRETSGRGVGTLQQGDALFPQSENLSHFSPAFPFFATVVLYLTSVCLLPNISTVTTNRQQYSVHRPQSDESQNGLDTKTG